MSELRQLIERLKHLPGKHNQRMHGRNSGGGGGGGASASSGGSSKPSKNDDISYAKQQLDRVDRQISKLEKRRINGQFPSYEMEAQHRELLSARAEYQDEIRRNTPDSSQAVRPYKPIVEPATSSESRQANRTEDSGVDKPDNVVDGVKLTKYDRDTIDATKELTRNGIKPSPNNEQTMEYARSAANDINSAGFLEGSVYGFSLETLEITPDGKLERREYPSIMGIGKDTHTPRQIRRVVNFLRETGRRAHYISNDGVDAVVISGNV